MPIAIELSSTLPEPGAEPDGAPAAGAVGVGLYAERLRSGDLPEGLDRGFLEAQGFTAEPGQSCVAPGVGGRLVVALGLGAEAAATPATFRRAGAALARAAGRRPRIAADLVDAAPDRLDRGAVGQAVVEGVLLGAYRYTALKSDPAPDHLESLTVLTQRADGLEPSLARGRAVGEAVRLAHPAFQQYFRDYRPPTLIVWGRNDEIFGPKGAEAYLRDLPEAELHLLDTGHFALEEECDFIAQKIGEFLGRHVV